MTQEPTAPPCPTCGYPRPGAECALCENEILPVDGVKSVRPGRRLFLIEFVEGFVSLFQASLLLMTRREFIGKIGLAIAANLALVLVFVLGTGFGFYSLLDSFMPNWGAVSATLAGILALVCVWFLASSLIQAGMTPFLDPIANATERMLAGERMKPVDLGLWRGLMAGLNAAAQILMLQIFVLVPMIVLSWIPVVNLVAIPAAFLVAAYLNAMVWFEIPVLRRGYGMAYRRRIVRRNWGRALGFGVAFNLGILVPFFNVLFLAPATAVAVSLLYFRFDKTPAASHRG
ncbi:MAG: EI24 domain-containing protein [Planctomycetes bacterium]|nr:EI24 domain-containing protein [Planctomycetota bacterium]MCB9870689.1 EI24 domain-containing protein [Planctomycetota bacterium]